MDFEHLLDDVFDAVLRAPGVRALVGLVSARWQPLWAATWFLIVILAALRAFDWFMRARLRRELLRSQAQATARAARNESIESFDGSGLTLPATPQEPVAEGPTPASEPPFWRKSLNSWGLAAGALVVALLALFARPSRSASVGGDQAAPNSARRHAFKFKDRGWRMDGATCVTTIEVQADAPGSRQLTMLVEDSSGSVLGDDVVRVRELKSGVLLVFRFKGVRCDDVENWQIQG